MRITVLGSGDAFGSGGRLQTSFHVVPDGGGEAYLIDCGVTALIGLDRAGLDPNAVATIFISHLHGDHFGGLVWWLLHGQHVARRTGPLLIAGPPGIEARFRATAEALYPGSTAVPPRFAMTFVELLPGAPAVVGGITVEAFAVNHPSGAPSYALRLTSGSGASRRTIAFSGDTEWVETLVDAARGADLFITECYLYDGPVRYHLSWAHIARELPRLDARRIMLTHMGRAMLARRDDIGDPRVIMADDGMTLDI